MCGLAGFVDRRNARDGRLMEETARRMSEALLHRGPDDVGAWTDPEAGIAFGHQRLSIIDLTEHGHQPMHSADGRYVLIYNGEVYNHIALRGELEARGHRFRGHSDTEIILAAVSEWGVEGAVRRFIGMFALGLWDRRERLLHLVRDRLGIKPLYYGRMGEIFLFASELHAIRRHPDFVPEIDREALALYFRFGHVPCPRSIYRGIHKLSPGVILTLDAEDPSRDPEATIYWSAREVAERGSREELTEDMDSVAERLDVLLREAIRLRMIADVPLGAFLSGGVDSSTVVALMQAQSSRSIRTFTIGFHEGGFDEASRAKVVARHIGTDHTELYVTARDALDVVPRLTDIYDEPFADSSQIPTFLICRLARPHVTVALTGDGGDELFGGYNRHFWTPTVWRWVRWAPYRMRAGVAGALLAIKPSAWSRFLRLAPSDLRVQDSYVKSRKAAEILGARTAESLYGLLVTQWKDPAALVIEAEEPATLATDDRNWPILDDLSRRIMCVDAMTYLPDDILTKVDRASMAVSLEARVPFLDHRVFEFSSRIPLSMKVQSNIRGGRGKLILRRVLQRYVPSGMMNWPKMGFAVPIGDWLRKELRDWAHDLLGADRLRREGLLRPEPVVEKWQQHLSGEQDWQHQLWCVLMFQAWLESQA